LSGEKREEKKEKNVAGEATNRAGRKEGGKVVWKTK